MKDVLKKYRHNFISQWLILALDLCMTAISFLLATAITYNFKLFYFNPGIFKYHLLLSLIVNLSFFLFFRTYKGIIRHTSVYDAKILTVSLFIAHIALAFISRYILRNWHSDSGIPLQIIILALFISIFILVSFRIIVKNVFESLSKSFKNNKTILIYGAGNLGVTTKNLLLSESKHNNHILYFIDDSSSKIGKKIEGIEIISKDDAKEFLQNTSLKISEIIFAIQSITNLKKNQILDEFLAFGVSMKVIPPMNQWINGTLSTHQIKNINIEDLLDRSSIEFNNRLVADFISNKTIFVTGASGSIGTELVRLLLNFKIKEIVLIDQNESGLYDIETELTRLNNPSNPNYQIEICDVSNKTQLKKLFVKYKPQIVFHAAAYKHVPLMELNPYKAIEVNTLGTKNMADLSSEFKVDKFLFVSTDKAVNPTNVMGASKRLAEMYVHSLNIHHKNDTRFVVTRFGNVLGSNGSVIPLFKKQIENGGPITITHPEIIRYFMTIPEACKLVLEASTMGKGGEIYVFDMGQPVKIYDLAKKMIILSGLEINEDIKIEFTGLREGEKLFEELLSDKETTIATHHPKILVAKVKSEDLESLKSELEKFEKELSNLDDFQIVSKLKNLVPEFKSNNSPYEILDNPISTAPIAAPALLKP